MISIFGESDHLVRVAGDVQAEFYASTGAAWRGHLVSPDGHILLIILRHERNGTWTPGIGLEGDGWGEMSDIPSWPLRVRRGAGRDVDPVGASRYSIVMEVDAPDGSVTFEASSR